MRCFRARLASSRRQSNPGNSGSHVVLRETPYVAWASQPMDSQGRRIRVFDTPLVSGLNALAAVVGLIALLFATAL